MAISLTDASKHIESFVIDNDDWVDADETKQQRILNVAERTLSDYFDEKVTKLVAVKLNKPIEDVTKDDYVMPSESVYELAAVLSRVFNDTNRMQQQGLAGFSITGVGSYTFKENNVKGAAGEQLDAFITKEAIKYIEKANGIEIAGRVIKDVVI
jgi:hypothetical protein